MMDPRNFHIQFKHAARSIQWDRPNGNEYFLVGDGENFYLDRLQTALDQHFSSETIWASPSRHEAIALEGASASGTIAQHAARVGSFTVFDHELGRFMQFTKMGVARQDVLQANNSFKPNLVRKSA